MGVLSEFSDEIVVGFVSSVLASLVLWLVGRHVTLPVLVRIRRLSGRARRASGIDFQRLAIAQRFAIFDRIVDRTHLFTRIELEFTIVGSNGFFRMRYQGRNLSDTPSQRLLDAVVADAPMDLAAMEIKAVQRPRKQELRWRVLDDEPYTKVLEFPFSQPIAPGRRVGSIGGCNEPVMMAGANT